MCITTNTPSRTVIASLSQKEHEAAAGEEERPQESADRPNVRAGGVPRPPGGGGGREAGGGGEGEREEEYGVGEEGTDMDRTIFRTLEMLSKVRWGGGGGGGLYDFLKHFFFLIVICYA